MAVEPRRGEIWLADLDKRRPAIILTRDPMGRFLNDLIVAPLTTKVRGLSTEVEVGAADGVRRPSVANLDNVRSVPKVLLVRRMAQAREETMHALCRALCFVVGCSSQTP